MPNRRYLEDSKKPELSEEELFLEEEAFACQPHTGVADTLIDTTLETDLIIEDVEEAPEVPEFLGFSVFSNVHSCVPEGDAQQYTVYEADPGTGEPWPPEEAADPESADPEDTGDFSPSIVPPFASQKNLSRVGFDPRTGSILMVQGTFGAFSETPSTSTKVLRSDDGGLSFVQVSDLSGTLEFYDAYEGFNDVAVDIPLDIEPGANPGEWFLFNFAGGYYLSVDNGISWTPRQESALGFAFIDEDEDLSPSHYGLFGSEGNFDTRNQAVHNYLD